MKQFYSYLLIIAVCAGLTSCSKGSNGGGATPAPRPDTAFANPLMQGSDPWVIQNDTNYFYTQTTDGNKVVLWKTSRMSSLRFAPQTTVYIPVSGTANSRNIWAPELHRLDGKWYLYFTAGSGEDSTQRIWVRENSGNDPTTGTWAEKGRIFSAGADFWSIDGNMVEWNGNRYFIWSGRPVQSELKQNLYIARMTNARTLDAQAVMISEPALGWERNGHPVNEAPQALINPQGKLFILYAASSCFTDDYALGMLTLKDGGNPLNAADWAKSPQPVFTKNEANSAYGPGHNSFFTSRNGQEQWVIYHANTSSGQGCGNSRNVRMQRFSYSPSGVPQFGTPVKAGAPLRKPGGE